MIENLREFESRLWNWTGQHWFKAITWFYQILHVQGVTGSQIHVSSDQTDGGGYLATANAGNLAVTGGAQYDGTNWYARSTSAAIVALNAGGAKIYSDTSLTSGNTFTPTSRLEVSGSGTVSNVDISRNGANGQVFALKQATAQSTALSGATYTFTNLIPVGSLVIGVTTRVTTLITGATSFDIGDGSDVDRWGSAVAVALNTTSNLANCTTQSPCYYTAATSVVLTANGSNFTAGVVRATVHYMSLTAETS